MKISTDNGAVTVPADSGVGMTLGRNIAILIEAGHVAVVDRLVQPVERCWNRWHQVVDGLRLDREGNLRIPAGLVPTLIRELARDGYRVEVHDRRQENLDDNNAIIDQMEGADRRYLEALVRNTLGIIEVPDNEDLITRIGQLAALYPDAKVVVAVVTRKLAWKVWRALGEKLNESVGLVTATTRKPGRCTVCAYRMLHKLGDRDQAILVVVEAERAVDVVAEFTTGKEAYSRVYGFIYADVTRDESADLGLKALAGETIYANQTTTKLKRVLMVPSPPVPLKPSGRGLERKRPTIWKNRKRNRLTAKVALALQAKDMDALHEYGVHLDRDELNGVRRVAVLVESTAHARELRSLLRGWPIYDMVPEELKGEQPPAATPATANGSIVTVMYAVLGGVDAEVIVRATGGHGEWPVDDGEEGEKPTVPLVIDFDDNFDQRARNDTQVRFNDYRNRGWPVEGAASLV